MIRIILLYLLIWGNISQTRAQTPFQTMGNSEDFRKQLEQTAGSVKSIACDFTQIKHLDLFNEAITSTGRFWYLAPYNIRLDYSSPAPYLIVIRENKLLTVSDGKKQSVDLSSNGMMQEIRNMLSACMSGNISRLKGYQMDFSENNDQYLVSITPVNQAVLEYIAGFDIYFDKKDLSVSRLRVKEPGNDYTEYLFTNKAFNSLTDEQKFLFP